MLAYRYTFLFNLPDWHFWLDLSCWTPVRSCWFSPSSCVRRCPAGLSMETLSAVSRGILLVSLSVHWTAVSSSFSGCRKVVAVFDLSLIVSVTWWDIGGSFICVESSFFRLAGARLNGLPLMSSFFWTFLKVVTSPDFTGACTLSWGEPDVFGVGASNVSVDI